jgi:hypothetical protein
MAAGLQKDIGEILSVDYNMVQGPTVVQENYGQTDELLDKRLASIVENSNILIQVKKSDFS